MQHFSFIYVILCIEGSNNTRKADEEQFAEKIKQLNIEHQNKEDHKEKGYFNYLFYCFIHFYYVLRKYLLTSVTKFSL